MKNFNPTIETHSELQHAYDYYNQKLFNHQLPRALITIQRKYRTYGFFSSRQFVNRAGNTTVDQITLHPGFFGVRDILETMQTLVHEMVHQWQSHFGKPGRGRYQHNHQWADKMESLGLMPSRTGKPGGARIGGSMLDYPIDGGLFMRVTNALFASGFQISWIDRYPPFIPDSLEGNPGFASQLVPPSNIKGSNRTRYGCPVCNALAWGKVNLNILCGNASCGAVAFVVLP